MGGWVDGWMLCFCRSLRANFLVAEDQYFKRKGNLSHNTRLAYNPNYTVKRDAIFYQIFKRFPNLFFELIGQSPSQVQDYCFESRLSRQEVEAMLGLSLEETKVYQEAKEAGRLEGRLELTALPPIDCNRLD